VIACVDGTATVHLSADRPVLLESCGANDRRRISALFLPDLVRSTIAFQQAVLRCASIVGWVVNAHGLDYVEFHEWVGRPPVEREVSIGVCMGVKRA